MPRPTKQAGNESKYDLDNVADEIPDTPRQKLYALRLWLFSSKVGSALIQMVGAILLDAGLRKTEARVLLVDRRQYRKYLADYVQQSGSLLSDDERLYVRNIALLAEVLELGDTEREILLFMCAIAQKGPLSDLLESSRTVRTNRQLITLIAIVIARPREEVAYAIEKGALVRSHLFTMDDDFQDLTNRLQMNRTLRTALQRENADLNKLVSLFFETAGAGTLGVADFPHLSQSIGLIEEYLRAVLRERRAGANILLYGPPGTGKTEFSRTIAARLEANLYCVRHDDDAGDSAAGHERFASYLVCQRFLRTRGRSVVVFDEIEDVLPAVYNAFLGVSRKHTSNKAWLNKVLETNAVPAFWIANDVSYVDPATLRRFDLVIEMATPPRSVRRAIVSRHTDGLAVSDEWIERTANGGASLVVDEL